jgi:ribose transport system ATP-binding protein
VAFLEMRGVQKRYGGVVALQDAFLRAERGQVHALLGANGSGKSTLSKILTGVVAPDHAEIELDGNPLTVTRPQDAHRHGIAAVYQELSLIPDLTVAANLVLAFEDTRAGFLRRRSDRARAAEVLERFRNAFRGGQLPLDTPVGSLTSGEQQIVEIAKALIREPRVLVLDEATASLYSAQVEVVFDAVRELRELGTLTIFTSHRLGEIFELCDRATVLRNGEVAGEVDLATTDEATLVELMVGSSLGVGQQVGRGRRAASDHGPGDAVRLRVRGLQTDRLRDVDLEVRAGEVLGLGGLAGQGQSELLNALFGAVRVRGGTLEVDGAPASIARPKAAVAAGLALVPGDRGREGLLPVRPILENLTVPSMRSRARGLGWLSQARERAAATRAGEQLGIKYGSLDDGIMTLSGGNQQKVVVGKWLLTEPRVVLLDDPTKGIDVGAKRELYDVIAHLTEEGAAVVLNSSDDDELLGLSDRVLVFFEGRVVSELAGEHLTRDRLVADSLQVVER